jgi:cephalosporin hydroxylase
VNELSIIALEACKTHGALQRPNELAIAAQTLAAIKPKLMLEIGCAEGGTLFVWTKICPQVYGITLPGHGLYHGAEVLFGDSHSENAMDWLLYQLDGRKLDALFIDGDHSYAGVRQDWEMYSPLVRDGGIVLFHDVASRTEPDVGKFWEDLGKGYVICDCPGSIMSIGFGVVEI